MEAEPIHYLTVVGDDGSVHLPGVKPGDRVELTVRRLEDHSEKPDRRGLFGFLKGSIHIRDDFDDPIPGMEDYV